MAVAEVEIEAPDIGAYRNGSAGIPYAVSLAAPEPGPHVVITALTHGNELCGAHALIALLERGIRPCRGRLSLAFVNVAAYARFEPRSPRASRYVDEDMNRLWDPRVLDGPRRSIELDRARELRPLIEDADWLLDLHSMQQAAKPLLLSGLTAKGRRLARAMGYPATVVADAGHRNGARMRDFSAFADPSSPKTAMLVECGQHWARASCEVAIATCRQFLFALEVVEPGRLDALGPPPPPAPPQVIEVTDTVVVEHGPFRFTESYGGLETIREAGTVIAYDGGVPVRTPYEDCVLVMPSQHLARGLTAVRLGRITSS
jgi:succinylglutamate desuccinylase